MLPSESYGTIIHRKKLKIVGIVGKAFRTKEILPLFRPHFTALEVYNKRLLNATYKE